MKECRCHHIEYTQMGKNKQDGTYCLSCGRKFLDENRKWVSVK